MSLIQNTLPVTGWRGEISITGITHYDGTELTENADGLVYNANANSVLVTVQEVSVRHAMNYTAEPRLGTREQIIIPTPVLFTGSFNLIRAKYNNWVHELLSGSGDNYEPYRFLIRISEIADGTDDPVVGIILSGCVINDASDVLSANGVMRVTYSFVATKMVPLTELDGSG